MQGIKTVLRRAVFTLFLIGILKFGQNIPLPGIDGAVAHTMFLQNDFWTILGLGTGAQFALPTILTLGLGPMMTSMIIWSAVTALDTPTINNMSYRAMGIIQNFITFFLAIIQAITIVYIGRGALVPLVVAGYDLVPFIAVVVLVAGAMIVVELANLNLQYGVGGQAVFILPGIIKGLPRMLSQGYGGNENTLELNPINITIALVLFLFVVILGIQFNRAELRVPLLRPLLESEYNDSYMPIRLLSAGAMPFMFSTTIFTLPKQIINNTSLDGTKLGESILYFTSFNTVGGIIFYTAIIVGLSYLFGWINLRPHQEARRLKESGDYIENVPPGDATEHFLTQKFLRVITIGNLFLVVISVLPLVIGLWVPTAVNFSFFMGSSMIFVSVFDTITQQIEALYNKERYTLLGS